MKDRIQKIRKDANLSMEKFGEMIGMTRSSVSHIEAGRNNPSDAAIKMICKEFNANEDWIKTGNGEPYIIRSRKEKITDFFADVLNEPDSSFRTAFIETLAELSVEDWEFLGNMCEKLRAKKD